MAIAIASTKGLTRDTLPSDWLTVCTRSFPIPCNHPVSSNSDCEWQPSLNLMENITKAHACKSFLEIHDLSQSKMPLKAPCGSTEFLSSIACGGRAEARLNNIARLEVPQHFYGPASSFQQL